jgi:hypothetical protein
MNILEKYKHQEKWYRWYETRQEDKEYMKIINRLKKIIKILTIIFVVINPILIIVTKINRKLIYFVRWVNYRLIRYYRIRKIIIYGLMLGVMRPILVMYWLYYSTLVRWRRIGVINILLKRVEGLILSILIMTDIYGYILKFVGIYWFVLILYIILIIITWKYEEINKFFDKTIIIININNVQKSKNNNTVIGIIIGTLIQLFWDLYEELNVHSYFMAYFPDKVDKLLQFESGITTNPGILMAEIKNKVSILMYVTFVHKMQHGLSNMQDWYLRVIQYKKEENKKIVEKMYEEQKRRFKESIFFLWEMDEYFGIKDSYKTYKFKPALYESYDCDFRGEKADLNNMEKTRDYYPDISENIEHYLKYFHDSIFLSESNNYMFDECVIEERCKKMERQGKEEECVQFWLYNEELVNKMNKEMEKVVKEVIKEWEEKINKQ